MLSYVTSKTSNRYITCNYTPGYSHEAMRVQSGAGYISRHMISPEAAAEIAERNAWLVGHNTLEGGWNRPERTNQDRTGVPMMIVLRDDGANGDLGYPNSILLDDGTALVAYYISAPDGIRTIDVTALK